MFIFGDSLLDNGNNNHIISLIKANFLPYGIDFNSTPTGRFSNGRNIGDIVAEELGLRQFPPPYLAPNSTGNAILQGVNYASALSGILEETGNFLYGFLANDITNALLNNILLTNISMIGRVTLQRQILFFGETKSQLINMLGENKANDLISNSIFIISAGSNDYLNNYLFPLSFDHFYYQWKTKTFRDRLVQTLSHHIKTLYKMGARKIAVAGIGPLGCTPFLRSILVESGRGCALGPNLLVKDFNDRTREMITQLNQYLPELFIIHADTFAILYDIVAHPHKYGFTNSKDACCGFGGRYNGIITCLPFMEYCQDRRKTVFWDAYHPTEAANIVIAKAILNGDLQRVYPMNIVQLANL
ncbi:GDSL esterase/lipase At4g16230-like [Cryptomeria japonica]|uniref:GDSL esterase/lipase At4g16230-like n=1 Tax=Cryptomeria japonica TaxID=3369 RepID=UPI0027DA28A4|nr:GDSL esterase/lipase At4g16230-like [Cryptomeria japonica]